MKRLFGLILASLMLLCACTAQADVLTEWNMTQGGTSDLIHKDVASTTVRDAVVTVEEVAYDGVTAFVFYTLKDTKTTELLGTLDSETGRYLINGDDYAYFADKSIGWFKDSILVNGKEYDMPLTDGLCFGSEEPGLQEYYMTIRLDQAGIGYGEAETLGLPISDRNGADGGWLTFDLDTSIKDEIVVERQDCNVVLGNTSATHVETVFGPVKVYVTVMLSPDAAAVTELGGDSQSSAVSVNCLWADKAIITDKNGEIMEDMMRGFSGPASISTDKAMFEYSAISEYPDELYLTIVNADGTPDMANAVRIH